ncbi:MAG: hypothetical protein KC468_11705, partial [Myxococcales bacterium]|nr:hypothetical protein [Myxococcales bacterium]
MSSSPLTSGRPTHPSLAPPGTGQRSSLSTIASIVAHVIVFFAFQVSAILRPPDEPEPLYVLTEVELPEPEPPPEP